MAMWNGDIQAVSSARAAGDYTQALLSGSRNFGLRVQAAIGPKILDGNGATGTVMVSFSLSREGSLAGARVTQSSGHARLDARALEIISAVAFPTPQGELTPYQMNYVSMFRFE
jgi:TonB family protein